MDTKITVLKRGAANFNMSGQFLGYPLGETEGTISAGLVQRLRRYALGRLAESGICVPSWACEVYTTDADSKPSDRMYCVEFTSRKGGKIGVQGILTRAGWPCLDHGLTIESA